MRDAELEEKPGAAAEVAEPLQVAQSLAGPEPRNSRSNESHDFARFY